MTLNIISGNDAGNTLGGSAGDDLIYGFDPNAAYASATVAATRVASGLTQPLFVAAPPGDTGRLFVVEKTGAIKILDLNTGLVLDTPFLNVSVDSSGERGLLGLAFDPDYASNGFFYVYRTVTTPTTHNVVERYQISSNPNVANAGSRQTIIDLDNLSGATNLGGSNTSLVLRAV
jgi:glucose/arabinose dehydrogenase